ncbi:hypothetical protein HMSP1_89 [Sinorhizobium phage HMSP1-Susan]|nr:hypothetical protein HMSP1_89 [Sinorhizobium phage HMSP1-Susan]
MKYEAWPQNDRLQRWRIVDASATGRGKPIIAENIRSFAMAEKIARLLNEDEE